MKIKVWGSRGSIPAPLTNEEYRKKIKKILKLAVATKNLSEESIEQFIEELPFYLRGTYGGNTTCIEITTEDSFIVIDGGTGLKELGKDIIEKDRLTKYGKIIHLLFTHTHWDHIQGIPFFKPLYKEDYTIKFYSPFQDIEKRLKYQHDFRFFPAKLEDTASKKEFIKIPRKGYFHINNVKILSHPLKHPGGSFGYRIEYKGKIFVFATDIEITSVEYERFEEYRDFFKNADILMIDAQYTLDEAMTKFEWGHTSYTMAINIGLLAKAKKIYLFHHDPFYKDTFLNQIYFDAHCHLRTMEKNNNITVSMTYEGLELEL